MQLVHQVFRPHELKTLGKILVKPQISKNLTSELPFIDSVIDRKQH
jgi:hypothetical protein